MQKIRPILFSTPMVQAILEGRKTMTRRLADDFIQMYALSVTNLENSTFRIETVNSYKIINPKVYIGDILWVRETFREYFQMTGHPYGYKATALEDGDPLDEKWKPSIFMPKSACRIWLEVTNVRLERLLDISEKDARMEGVICEKIDAIHKWKDYSRQGYLPSAKFSFFSLWEKINGKESVSENPWIWVYEFKKVEMPINFLN